MNENLNNEQNNTPVEQPIQPEVQPQVVEQPVQQEVPMQEQVVAQPKNNKFAKIVFIVLIVALILGGGFFAYMHFIYGPSVNKTNNGNDDNNNTSKEYKLDADYSLFSSFITVGNKLYAVPTENAKTKPTENLYGKKVIFVTDKVKSFFVGEYGNGGFYFSVFTDENDDLYTICNDSNCGKELEIEKLDYVSNVKEVYSLMDMDAYDGIILDNDGYITNLRGNDESPYLVYDLQNKRTKNKLFGHEFVFETEFDEAYDGTDYYKVATVKIDGKYTADMGLSNEFFDDNTKSIMMGFAKQGKDYVLSYGETCTDIRCGSKIYIRSNGKIFDTANLDSTAEGMYAEEFYNIKIENNQVALKGTRIGHGCSIDYKDHNGGGKGTEEDLTTYGDVVVEATYTYNVASDGTIDFDNPTITDQVIYKDYVDNECGGVIGQ